MKTKNFVLLVEDQPALRSTLERALRFYNYDVKSVENLAEAKDCFACDPVDVLLSDVALAGPTDGFELAGWARALWPRMPIVLISGLALFDAPVDIVLDRHVRLLAKPFSVAALMQILMELLQLR